MMIQYLDAKKASRNIIQAFFAQHSKKLISELTLTEVENYLIVLKESRTRKMVV